MVQKKKEVVEDGKTDVQAVDDKALDAAVKFINERANETVYKGSIEIGGYILENFFNNDENEASSKNPRKNISFNDLCEREDLIVHPNQLGLMVRVASQEKYFNKNKIDTKGLSYTHKASLVKMDNDVNKTNMIKKCIKQNWTTRQLEDAVKKYLDALPSAPKPSLIRTTKKYINTINTVLVTVEDESLNFDSNDITKMTSKKREDLKKHLKDLESKAKEGIDRSTSISERCSAALEKLDEIETEINKNPPKRGRPAMKK